LQYRERTHGRRLQDAREFDKLLEVALDAGPSGLLLGWSLGIHTRVHTHSRARTGQERARGRERGYRLGVFPCGFAACLSDTLSTGADDVSERDSEDSDQRKSVEASLALRFVGPGVALRIGIIRGTE
jgi:hypothetical protein